jgi:pilus assembly protein CpaF
MGMQFLKNLEYIKESVYKNIGPEMELTDEKIRDIIVDTVFDISGQNYINLGAKKELVETVFNSIRGLDVLQPLVDDQSITEIMVNGPENIFVERDGKTERVDICFESAGKLEDIIHSVVSRANRTVNESVPIVDARLHDGSRVNVVLKPIALDGPIMTIRKFGRVPLTMEKLIGTGTITEEAAAFLANLVRAGYNIFISGGTNSGKTTFLNALAGFIPSHERVITIEDSAELVIKGIENLVRMETRNANTEGKGVITIRDLIRTSLRMRPDRIIVGEVRGPEALDMLQAMNTGHDGSLSTGHANSAADMITRLETMVLMAADIPLEAVRHQIASAIDVIVHLCRTRDGSRKVMEIAEIKGCENSKAVLNPLYQYKGALERTGNGMLRTSKLLAAGMEGDLNN